jgi:hypothetical protein
MRKLKPGRCLFLFIATCCSLLCLALITVFFNPLPLLADIISVSRIRWELPRAMERWDSQGISDYQMHVKGAVPLACILDGEFSVQDGQLVQVRLRENALVPETSLRIINPGDWDTYGCSFQDLTIEAMFDRVESNLQEVGFFGAPLTIQFDDAAGYITEYRLGRSSRGGILEPRVSECCTWFEFSNLTYPAP